eukprot:m.387618 g.387618  ORF g.387618 m.387618 type:complete len:63 (+) comp20066_c6_seq2:2049-2237(+)
MAAEALLLLGADLWGQPPTAAAATSDWVVQRKIEVLESSLLGDMAVWEAELALAYLDRLVAP